MRPRHFFAFLLALLTLFAPVPAFATGSTIIPLTGDMQITIPGKWKLDIAEDENSENNITIRGYYQQMAFAFVVTMPQDGFVPDTLEKLQYFADQIGAEVRDTGDFSYIVNADRTEEDGVFFQHYYAYLNGRDIQFILSKDAPLTDADVAEFDGIWRSLSKQEEPRNHTFIPYADDDLVTTIPSDWTVYDKTTPPEVLKENSLDSDAFEDGSRRFYALHGSDYMFLSVHPNTTGKNFNECTPEEMEAFVASWITTDDDLITYEIRDRGDFPYACASYVVPGLEAIGGRSIVYSTTVYHLTVFLSLFTVGEPSENALASQQSIWDGMTFFAAFAPETTASPTAMLPSSGSESYPTDAPAQGNAANVPKDDPVYILFIVALFCIIPLVLLAIYFYKRRKKPPHKPDDEGYIPVSWLGKPVPPGSVPEPEPGPEPLPALEDEPCPDTVCEPELISETEPSSVPQPDEPVPEHQFCRFCGQPIKADARFCRYCGKELGHFT